MRILNTSSWTLWILLFSCISIDFLITGTFAAEAKGGAAIAGAAPKVKGVECKEAVEDALKKRDQGKDGKGGPGSPVISDEDDDDDDDDSDSDSDSDSDEDDTLEDTDEDGIDTKENTKESKGKGSDSKKDTKKDSNTTEDDDDESDDSDDDSDEDDDDDDDSDSDSDEDDSDESETDEDGIDTEEDLKQAAKAKGAPTPAAKPGAAAPAKVATPPAKAPPAAAPKAPEPKKPEPVKAAASAAAAKKPEPVKPSVPEKKPLPPPPASKVPEPKKPAPAAPVKATVATKDPPKPTVAPSKPVVGKDVKKTPVLVKDSDEDDSDEDDSGEIFKSRSQIEDILRLYDIGTKQDMIEQTDIKKTFTELKKIYESSIKPLETLFKYKQMSSRVITDAELFSKPMVLFLGAKSSGKTSLINYLLGLESTPWQLRVGMATSPPQFTILEHGDQFSKLSPMELSADFAFSNLQQFGQDFVENHLAAFRMPLSILHKITIVDSPGLLDGILSKTTESGKSVDAEVYQWFVDRADIIFIVVDSNQVVLTQSMKDLLEQLKGRDVRFILSKAETMTQTQAVMVMGQLLWTLSPVMPSDKPPQVYALTTAPADEYNDFLENQEEEWLTDLAGLISGVSRVEARASAVRRHAVRVRNHAKVVDAYLSSYYRFKPMFCFGQACKKLGCDITENPTKYNIFKGSFAGVTQNVSRYDLPDPDVYRDFFRTSSLLEFNQLSATCSFLGGCPLDSLDRAISFKLPDLVSKYKKSVRKPPPPKGAAPVPTKYAAPPAKGGKK